MAETSTKPYMIRALYEWCCDNGYTPYLAVAVDEHTIVPRQHVKGGVIVLNVSPMATSRLTLGNEVVEFQARFSGLAQQISVPIANISAIYARETGQGMAFDVSEAPAESDEDADPDASGSDDEVGNHAPGSSVQQLRGGSRRRGPRSVDREDTAGTRADAGRDTATARHQRGEEGDGDHHAAGPGDLHPAEPGDRAANSRKSSSKQQGSADVIAFAPSGGTRKKKAGSPTASPSTNDSEPADEPLPGTGKSDDDSEDPPPSDGGSQGGKGGKARLTRVK
jgi:stringent starvation protein B